MARWEAVDTEKLDADLSDVADAIRAKTGNKNKLDFPDGFQSAIDGISNKKIIEKIITEKGTYNADDDNADGYNPVVVNVSPKLGTKTITKNNVYYYAFNDGVDGYAAVMAEVDTTQAYENGRKAERDAFWDGFQQNGQRNNYSYAFTSTYWTDDVYHPIHPIVMSGGNTNAYYNNTVTTNTKVPIDIRGTVLNNTFRYATALETIPELIVDETTQIGAGFSNAAALKNITISGKIGQDLDIHWSPLSADSVQSIIDALKDLNGDTAKTLTLHQNAGAALTAEQKAAITAKNWTLVY